MQFINPYPVADAHLVDYQMYRLAGVPQGYFRGPAVTGDAYIACVGAAQTFGRFVRQPFPQLLARSLGVEVLNLGRGGAGPGYPLSSPALLEYINRARLVVVQVLSGRSQSNSLFRTRDHGMRGTNVATGGEMEADEFYTWLLAQDPDLARNIVAETRANYVAAMTTLLEAITAPKLLLWFSTRTPEYTEQCVLPAWKLFGEFPQLVNRAMMDELAPRADRYVECVSKRGWPQRIVDLNGNPSSYRVLSAQHPQGVLETENRYYPSPEMHEDAAGALLPACRALLGEH